MTKITNNVFTYYNTHSYGKKYLRDKKLLECCAAPKFSAGFVIACAVPNFTYEEVGDRVNFDPNPLSLQYCNNGSLDFGIISQIDLTDYGGNITLVSSETDIINAFDALGIDALLLENCILCLTNNNGITTPVPIS